MFVILPILVVVMILIVRLILAAIYRDRQQALQSLSWLTIVLAIPMTFYLYERQHPLAIHETVEWWKSSREYKDTVLAEGTSVNGDLKHIEWEFMGPSFAATTVYLVFDPSDSLAAAAKSHQPGKFAGLPCKVYEVRRLESRWYAVVFYRDETWDECS